MRVKSPTRLLVVASPIRSRGCSEVGKNGKEGHDIVIAMASPKAFSLRRFARLFEHEVTHKLGSEHEDMSHRVLWSLGDIPDWAKGATFRYYGRAPSQMDLPEWQME